MSEARTIGPFAVRWYASFTEEDSRRHFASWLWRPWGMLHCEVAEGVERDREPLTEADQNRLRVGLYTEPIELALMASHVDRWTLLGSHEWMVSLERQATPMTAEDRETMDPLPDGARPQDRALPSVAFLEWPLDEFQPQWAAPGWVNDWWGDRPPIVAYPYWPLVRAITRDPFSGARR